MNQGAGNTLTQTIYQLDITVNVNVITAYDASHTDHPQQQPALPNSVPIYDNHQVLYDNQPANTPKEGSSNTPNYIEIIPTQKTTSPASSTKGGMYETIGDTIVDDDAALAKKEEPDYLEPEPQGFGFDEN